MIPTKSSAAARASDIGTVGILKELLQWLGKEIMAHATFCKHALR